MLACLNADIDPTYFILENFLPHPFYRTTSQILLSYVLRGISVYLCSVDLCRSIMIGGSCLIICIQHCSTVYKTLLAKVRDFKGFYKYYTMERILFQNVESLSHKIIYMTFSLSFWTLLAACWICVKCNGRVPEPLYFCAILVLILLVLGHMILLPLICQVTSITQLIIKVHLLRIMTLYTRKKTRRNKWEVMQTKACSPIKVKYGWFFELRREFVMEYCALIMVRCFDVVLIVDY